MFYLSLFLVISQKLCLKKVSKVYYTVLKNHNKFYDISKHWKYSNVIEFYWMAVKFRIVYVHILTFDPHVYGTTQMSKFAMKIKNALQMSKYGYQIRTKTSTYGSLSQAMLGARQH